MFWRRLVQVADTVGDHSGDGWFQLAAACLRSAAVEQIPSVQALESGSSSCETLGLRELCSYRARKILDALPCPIQREILSAALTPNARSINDLLAFLSESLNAAIQPPHKTLEACFKWYPRRRLYFNALCQVPASPPSTALLHISFTHCQSRSEAKCM